MNKKRTSTTKAIIEKGTEKVKNIVKADEEIFKECLNIIASTKEGHYVFNRLLERCGQLKSSVILLQSGVDEGTTEYREGRRSIWLHDIFRYLNRKNLTNILFLERKKICASKKKIQEKV